VNLVGCGASRCGLALCPVESNGSRNRFGWADRDSIGEEPVVLERSSRVLARLEIGLARVPGEERAGFDVGGIVCE
jgi:hypothetical protein